MRNNRKYDPDIHKRRSIRLEGYDYSQPGAYFVTVLYTNRLPLFGAIVANGMILNLAGKMIDRWWNELKHNFRNIELDQYVVMPDHFHGIIQIQGAHAGAPLLSEILGRSVDLATPDALYKALRDQVLSKVVRAA